MPAKVLDHLGAIRSDRHSESENMLHLGRRLFGILVLGFLVAVLVGLGRLPPVVASHFDGAGVPNAWASRAAYSGLIAFIGTVLPLGTIGLITALTRQGLERLNIPARDYWLRPENTAEAVRRVRAYVWWLGCIMTATTLGVHGLILEAHTRQPPRLSTQGIVALLAAVLLGIGLWIVGWYSLLRPRPAR